MKQLILLLLFIPLLSFGQEQTQATVIQQYTTNRSSTNVENELVLSEEKTNIKTPLTADLSIYTHVLIVNVTNIYGQMNKTEAQDLEKMLSLTIFKVMNPYKVHKRAKKEPSFLKTVKNESYLYLYLNRTRGRGDDVNTTFIIRDSKNKIVYNATHINTGLNEILAPLIDY